ncbi:STAS domain-containing protein [Streptomyces sp. NPDC048566]|uniref:STAS domain-containing protein n=1 Tax=Streptomyces sp. NPDC048566 TaxID=3365569 RepID=UPI003711F7B7
MRITTMTEGHRARITPHAAIDLDVLPDLRAALHALPEQVTTVVWDLRDTPFMDSAGLHLLFDPPTTGESQPRTRCVTGLTPQPLRLLLTAEQIFPTLNIRDVVCDDSLEPTA